MKIILFTFSLLFLSMPTDLVNGDGYKIGDVATPRCRAAQPNDSRCLYQCELQ